jgi:hypothetical protein
MSEIDAPGSGGFRDDSPMVSARDDPPGPINWNLLDADQAAAEWRDLDAFVHWLKTTFGLSPAIVPPYWHRHDELIWELSALAPHSLPGLLRRDLVALGADRVDARLRRHSSSAA